MSMLRAVNLRNVFYASVEAVKPGPAIRKHVKLIDNQNQILSINEQNDSTMSQAIGINIAGTSYPLYTPKKDLKVSQDESQQCHYSLTLIGFGKAVLGMAKSLLEILSAIPNFQADEKSKGVLLVPKGSYNGELESHQWIEVVEGAEGNIPDENALNGAIKVYELVKDVKASAEKNFPKETKELIIVLISGGGSALLTYPTPPISLPEYSTFVRDLPRLGADIVQLNKVRSCISMLQGGNLVELANPANICSLILSDVIGDPLDMIASGPTVKPKKDIISRRQEALSIINKFGVSVPNSINLVLNDKTCQTPLNGGNNEESRVSNILIGTNLIALKEVQNQMKALGVESFILTSELSGEASDIGRAFAALGYYLSKNTIPSHDILKALQIESSILHETLSKLKNHNSPVCLISGGETIVKVKGKGKGGRNQEMALSTAIHLHELTCDQKVPKQIRFLSAGTDGIDGPTDVAGAIVDSHTIQNALKMDLNAQRYLENNDSYTFFHKLNNGENFVKTGHTGTNVMDIQLILIE